MLQDPDDALSKLSLLRSAGVGVALDDFGTGYSSLSRLSLLPVDTLKIDRSFVTELPAKDTAMTIVSTIITLARAFSLTTVAEGVETAEQLQVAPHPRLSPITGIHSQPAAIPGSHDHDTDCD